MCANDDWWVQLSDKFSQHFGISRAYIFSILLRMLSKTVEVWQLVTISAVFSGVLSVSVGVGMLSILCLLFSHPWLFLTTGCVSCKTHT